MSKERDDEQVNKDDVETMQAYQQVFFDSQFGKDVLCDLLNECGFFATDPNAIKPELNALGNRILMKLGVYDGSGSGLLQYMEIMKKSTRRM